MDTVGYAATPLRVPVIDMPKNVRTGNYGTLMFSIPTDQGEITVKSCGYGKLRWACRATAPALAAYGLINLAWLPGLPGNNSTRQTIFFTQNGPQLFYGNPRSYGRNVESIIIVRLSSRVYEVLVPLSNDYQRQMAETAHEQWCAQEQRQREEEAERERQHERQVERTTETAECFRALIRGGARASADFFDQEACSEANKFRFEPSTEAAIREHLATVRRLVDEGRIQLAATQYEGGNVVPIRR